MTGALLATSAPVTNWPLRIVLVALVVLVILGVLAAMRRGWSNRGRRQSDLPEPHPIPDDAESTLDVPVTGVYLGSVMAGDWLDRVVAHGLGTRSRVDIGVGSDGITLDRPGARSLFIPGSDLLAVRRERGIAGKAFEKDAVVVLTWSLGSTAIDTGVRPDHAEQAESLVAAAASLLHSGPGHLDSTGIGPCPPPANPGSSESESSL